ncbi:sugar ABC transporter substrate-binding protein [Bifidobacterium sp. CP2]|uniref:ABC transporter substrate-binding protein n=2 Tax=Bifidobacterium TaxID=1678 RepID=UPI001BDD9BCA|nr:MULTISPECIES: sugar ABC transporter substrate-binding protein [Bifidobacterium]MBT1181781.1 sugar ABC transporter substrate-binding protein [Bifidobacterium sp. CP2]MBW3081623.1 sugar ABC transporter substrate-binding protein [Bifidobacterium saguinibicoloris]
MMLSIKKTVALVGAAAMLVSVAACGSDNASGGSASDGGKTTLTVWGWDSTLKDVAKKFMQENPDITVKVNNVGTSAQTQVALNNAIAAGKGAPDIAQMEYHSVTQFALSDGIEDLSSRASGYESFYQEGTWKGVQVNGKTYGLPIDSGPNALFYNKEVFDKAGVTEAPKTWDEFYEAAKKIHALGDDYYITSDAGDNSQSTTFMSLIAQAGGTPFKVDGEKVSINLTKDEGTQKVVDYWQKMLDEGLINTKVTSWSDEWNKGLNDGTIASLVIGAWMPNNLLSGAPDASGKFRIATVPQWTEGGNVNSENGGSSLVMPKGGANQDAAWKFMEYCCHDKEGIKTRVDAGAFPADNDTLKSDDFLKGNDKLTEYFGGQEYNKVLAEAAGQKIGDFQFLPFWSQVQNTFGDYAGKAYRGEEKLSKSISDFQDSLVKYGKDQGFTVE